MVAWLNRTVVQAPRNGTSSHTVDFTPAAAGRLLVCVVEGAVTSTTPTGWTLRASAVNNTGLYVWSKTAAAGESQFVTTHNGANYPVGFTVYEFPAGAAWGTSAQGSGVGHSSASPTLSGLTGTNLLCAVYGQVNDSATARTLTWAAPYVEDVDVNTVLSGTDGYLLGVAFLEASTLTSTSPTPTNSAGGLTTERVTFAMTMPAGGTSYTGTPADTAAGTDAVTAVVGKSAVGVAALIIEQPAGVDTVSTASDAPRAAGDTAAAADTAGAGMAAVRAVSDPAGLTDAVQVIVERASSATAADPAAGTDTAGTSSSAVRVLVDSASGSDEVQAFVDSDTVSAIDDTAAGTDQVTLEAAAPRTAADSMAGSDSTGAVLQGVRAAADGASGSDQVSVELVGAGQALIDEDVQLSDTVTAVLQRVVTVDDLLQVIDDATAAAGRVVQVDDTAELEDGLQVDDVPAVELTVQLVDRAGGTDTVTAVRRTLVDVTITGTAGPAPATRAGAPVAGLQAGAPFSRTTTTPPHR